MKLQITKYLAIELTEPNELIELISDDDKVKFMQSLSSHDVVFKHVSDQIIHGCTEGGYSASQSYGDKPSQPLDIAIREVSRASGDIAKREIERLERKVSHEIEQKNKYIEMYYDLVNKGRLLK